MPHKHSLTQYGFSKKIIFMIIAYEFLRQHYHASAIKKIWASTKQNNHRSAPDILGKAKSKWHRNPRAKITKQAGRNRYTDASACSGV